MDIQALLSQLTTEDATRQIASTTNISKESVANVIQLGLPTLLNALNTNAQSPQGASSLSSALDHHANSDVSNIFGLLKHVDLQDGAKIIKNILGGQTSNVETKIAKETGINAGQANQVLAQIAPVIMGILGNQKKQDNISVDNLSSMIPTGLNGSTVDTVLSFATSILDKDKDGDILDDVADIFGGIFKK